MTAILAFNLGAYALFVADTRRANLTSGSVNDDQLKITQTPFGFISGAGSEGMVRMISDRAVDRGLGFGALPLLVESFRHDIVRDPTPDRIAVDLVKRTHILFTAMFQPSDAVVGLGVLRPTPGGQYALRLVLPGDAWICGPTTDANWRTWRGRCRDGLAVCPAGSPHERLAETLAINLRLAASVMRDISLTSAAVAPTFQVGIHVAPATFRLSGICVDPPTPASLVG